MTGAQFTRVVRPRCQLSPTTFLRRPEIARRVCGLSQRVSGGRRLRICKTKSDREFDSQQLEHFSAEESEEISPEEWEAIKRVADRLFPEELVDWDGLWSGDSYPDWLDQWNELLEHEGEMNPSLPQYEASVLGQSAWMKKALKYLATRPDYREPVKDDWARSEYEVEEEPTYGKEFDPDWNDIDFYAMMQKRKARELERRKWRKKQREEVGKYRYVDTIMLDSRVPEEAKNGYRWTDEEAWDVITQKGRAFDPRKDKGPWRELNPNEVPDWAGEGIEYVEEIDEFLENSGRLVESDEFFHAENLRLTEVSRLEEAYPGGIDPEILADEE